MDERRELVTHEKREALREALAIAYRAIERAQEEFPNPGNLERLNEISELMGWVREIREVKLADWENESE